jgi:predicted aldo/keto reductase-like oxidoreductase
MQRRSFLRAVGGLAGSGAMAGAAASAQESGASAPAAVEQTAGLPRRVLGRTGNSISIVGFPGLALIHAEQEACTAAIHDAIQRGVNYLDVAPAYGNGDAEIKMGRGLEGIERDSIFLACKTKVRDRDGARQELERSLERLKTDYFDLYQLHCLIDPEKDAAQALAPGGAMEAILQAKQEGKVRHVGFSAHTTKAAIKAMTGFRFDTAMFPINFIEHLTLGFGPPVLEMAREQEAAVLAIKPMCRGLWPEGTKRTRRWWYRPMEDDAEIGLALRFTLSQPPVVAGLPPAFLDLLDKAIEAGKKFRPITDAETQQLRELAATCESVFRREEQKVAFGSAPDGQPIYPDSPHECCWSELV